MVFGKPRSFLARRKAAKQQRSVEQQCESSCVDEYGDQALGTTTTAGPPTTMMYGHDDDGGEDPTATEDFSSSFGTDMFDSSSSLLLRSQSRRNLLLQQQQQQRPKKSVSFAPNSANEQHWIAKAPRALHTDLWYSSDDLDRFKQIAWLHCQTTQKSTLQAERLYCQRLRAMYEDSYDADDDGCIWQSLWDQPTTTIAAGSGYSSSSVHNDPVLQLMADHLGLERQVVWKISHDAAEKRQILLELLEGLREQELLQQLATKITSPKQQQQPQRPSLARRSSSRRLLVSPQIMEQKLRTACLAVTESSQRFAYVMGQVQRQLALME